MDRAKPLYRKVSTRTHGVRHGHAGEYKWSRHTKAETQSDVHRGSMHPNLHHGRDYTPLFRFLLSRVGRDWDPVHSEAVSRLDSPDPIFWMVALRQSGRQAVILAGESSYFSGLYVDDENHLAIVDPALSHENMEPSCRCCTHTFNGQRFTRRYER